jgi:hypothetical protein
MNSVSGLPWWASLEFGNRWSKEEQWTRGTIYIIGAVINVTPLLGMAYLLRWAGLDKHNAALIGAIICFPPSVYLGRLVCIFLWPDFVRTADENAAQRMRGSE